MKKIHSVWFHDPTAADFSFDISSFEEVTTSKAVEKANRLFVFSTVNTVREISQALSRLNHAHHLRGLFLKEDVESTWIPQVLEQANLRILKNLIIYTTPELPKRILEAWNCGAQRELIARASIVDKVLRVQSCEFEIFDLPLQRLPRFEEKANVELSVVVADDGAFLEIPELQMDMDLESLRYLLVPAERVKFDAIAALSSELIGKAIRQFRKSGGLRQTDFGEISERHLRRIESGETLTVATVKGLAAAHSMNVNDYLNRISEIVHSFKESKPQSESYFSAEAEPEPTVSNVRESNFSPEDVDSLIGFLKEEMTSGRMESPLRPEFERALESARYDPTGKIDVRSVDSELLTYANEILKFRERQLRKAVPMQEIQSTYMEMLSKYFEPVTRIPELKKLPNEAAARVLSNDSEFLAYFDKTYDSIFEKLREFWSIFEDCVSFQLQDSKTFKTVFGGDIFPNDCADLVGSLGLYVDTLVLPDPLLRLANYKNVLDPQQLCYQTVKHGLSALSCKRFIEEWRDPPIVIFAPDPTALYPEKAEFVKVAGQRDVILHCSQMFERDFQDINTLLNFFDKIDSVDGLERVLRKSNLLLFDSEWTGSISENFSQFKIDISNRVSANAAQMPVGMFIFTMLLGRMTQASDLVLKNAEVGGIPVIHAPTSWRYFLWKHEFELEKTYGTDTASGSLVVRNLLNDKSDELRVLSGLPEKQLMTLRSNGAAAEIRQLLGSSVTPFGYSSRAETLVRKELIASLESAFEEHSRVLDALARSNASFFGTTVTPFIATASLAVAALLGQNPYLGALSVLAAIKPATGLFSEFSKISAETNRIYESPIGVLFRRKDKRS